MKCLGCCFRRAPRGPSAADRLQDELRSIKELYPGAATIVLLRPTGDVIATCPSGASVSDEFCEAVVALKRTAAQFAYTIDPRPYRSMRVEGERTTLSCFEVASAADAPAMAMLAFFMPSLDGSDCESQDADMRRRVPRVAELLLLQHQQQAHR